MSIDPIKIWHERARPKPDTKDFNVQAGCHFAEVAEMLEEMTGADEYADVLLFKATVAVHRLAEAMKSGEAVLFIRDRQQFLDRLCDQIVTSVGVGHCAHMNITEAVRRVNASNWSKTVNGEFLRDRHGKIIQPECYQPPDLGGLT